jgi:DNA-binding GntR family transcriptional regulator
LPKITTIADAERALERLQAQLAVENLTTKDPKKLKDIRKKIQTAKAVLAALNKNK